MSQVAKPRCARQAGKQRIAIISHTTTKTTTTLFHAGHSKPARSASRSSATPPRLASRCTQSAAPPTRSAGATSRSTCRGARRRRCSSLAAPTAQTRRCLLRTRWCSQTCALNWTCADLSIARLARTVTSSKAISHDLFWATKGSVRTAAKILFTTHAACS